MLRHYPGTVLWRFETLLALLQETIMTFLRHGFTHILLLFSGIE